MVVPRVMPSTRVPKVFIRVGTVEMAYEARPDWMRRR